jgi:hypothetical protein
VHREVDPLNDPAIEVGALHRSRQVEVAAQEGRRVRHRADHRPRLTAALDQLVQQRARLAVSLVHGNRLDASHETTSIAGCRTFYPNPSFTLWELPDRGHTCGLRVVNLLTRARD